MASVHFTRNRHAEVLFSIVVKIAALLLVIQLFNRRNRKVFIVADFLSLSRHKCQITAFPIVQFREKFLNFVPADINHNHATLCATVERLTAVKCIIVHSHLLIHQWMRGSPMQIIVGKHRSFVRRSQLINETIHLRCLNILCRNHIIRGDRNHMNSLNPVT